ncbi:uncharacterized protein [Periplaneta americana]|uniref:uncharacterized protein isoform X2 n=1 Tax=Periplaneta americana TaxID=6978 RepID=UPI0037E77C0C
MTDVIKMEPALDLLGLQLHDNTYEMEGNEPLSEEGNLSHLEMTGMKTECGDYNYDINAEMKVEDSIRMSTRFPMMKSEVYEDSFDLDRVQQEQKVEASTEEDKVLSERSLDSIT